MAKYIAKRVALALVTLVIVSMLTFFLMFLVPGGPFLSEKSPSPAVLAAMEEKYGLDKPVIVQYKNYMLNLLQGELGPSIKQRGRTVAQIIGSRFPVSARIGGIALAIAVVVGVVLGSVAALNRGKWIDNVIIVIATCGIAVPSFVVCTILLYIFSLKLGWLPSYGLTGWKNYIMPRHPVRDQNPFRHMLHGAGALERGRLRAHRSLSARAGGRRAAGGDSGVPGRAAGPERTVRRLLQRPSHAEPRQGARRTGRTGGGRVRREPCVQRFQQPGYLPGGPVPLSRI